MSRSIVAILGAIAVSAVVVSAQDNKEKKAQPAEGTKYVGCLSQGSTQGTFTLSGATEKGKKGTKMVFKVVPASDKVDLASRVSNQVEITGTASGEGVKEGESGVLPTISATKVSWKADYCG
jgi:hypothetical protein